MIIKTDAASIALNRSTLAMSTRDTPVSLNASEKNRIPVKSIVNRLSVERSLGDALSIAQMSQSVIQKAISISMRLKSIATSAIASGRVNTQELTETLSDIRSTLGSYGDQLPNPIQTSTTPSAKIVEMPDISNEMKSIRSIARSLQNGEFSQGGAIEAVNRNLGEQLKSYRLSESRITQLMRETTAGYTPTKSIPAGDLVEQIRTTIEANPRHALSIQGNINYSNVERLMA